MSDVPRISHHAAECWTIRSDFAQAQIFVRHGKHLGRVGYPDGTTWVSVAIMSDFGSWAHHWNHCGPADWREFLASLDRDYAMSKLMGAKWLVFSAAATLREARRSVIERRRTGELSRLAAREGWDEINDLDAYGEQDENAILRAFSTCDAFRNIYWDMSMHEPSTEGAALWRIIWRPWVTHLLSDRVPV